MFSCSSAALENMMRFGYLSQLGYSYLPAYGLWAIFARIDDNMEQQNGIEERIVEMGYCLENS